MDTYIYKGPVMLFDTCVNPNWSGETYSSSEKKARSNLAFQYKTQNNLARTAKITLPGKITKGEK